jgi:putative transcriptional regulator
VKDVDFENFNLYEELKTSLEEAIAYEKGDHSMARVSVRTIPVPAYRAKDVVRARAALNLTQKGLANAMGVSPRTVEAWEAGKNEPSGAARRLLYLFECDHTLVDHLITR